jgi:thiol-disulfide isomerase/thioredoxin
MIKNLNDSNFSQKGDSYYINEAKPTGGLLMVKADWCGHCKRTLPILEDLSKKLGDSYPIYKLDSDANPRIVAGLNVQGFPTIFYVNRDGKVGKRFNDDRSVPSFLNGICKEALVCKK